MVLHIIIIIGGSHDSGLSKALMESPSHSVQKPLCCDCCILCWVDQINKHLLLKKSSSSSYLTLSETESEPEVTGER